MNIFNFDDFTFMVDYAHNPHGLKALGKFIKAAEASVKIGIIAGVGDRRDQDIIALGEESAKIFDEIIIRQDRDPRGRTEDQIRELLIKGISQVDPYKKISSCSKEMESIHCAIEQAVPGSFIVLLSDDVKGTLEVINQYKQKKEPLRRLQANRA
jgi:cyanophycin synthetase